MLGIGDGCIEDKRNVVDRFKGWTVEAIRASLDTKRHDFAVLCANIHGDFNIGTIIRNANAFLAKNVFVLGRKKYDRRGTVGTHNYENFAFYKEIDDLEPLRSLYTFVAIDNVEGAHDIRTFKWPRNSLMLFGEEGIGLPAGLLASASATVYIPQYGSVRSLNVGTASGIAMYDYTSKLGAS